VTLVCPSCGRDHRDDERFCEACAVPLVVEGGPVELELDERGERMRKIKRQYSEGSLVGVAMGRNLAEAELIQNLLLEEGVPSTLRRTRGFDVPEMLAAGPRDVLVPASGEAAAREVLRQAQVSRPPARAPQPRAVRIVAGVLVAIFVLGFAAWLVLAVAR
jgi:hypothetical protein